MATTTNLHNANTRANVDQQVREDVGVRVDKLVLRILVPIKLKLLVRDVTEQEVASFDEARHLILLVHTKSKLYQT